MPIGTPVDRFRAAYNARAQTDYYFENLGMVIFLTIITCGIFGFYVFYQLMRRMRDHNARRLELLDAATTAAWEQAGRQGLQQELTPSFQRVAGQLAVMRQMTSEFREPVIWVALAVVAHGSSGPAGIANAIRLAARAVSERAVERTAELLAATGTTRAALRDRNTP